MENLMKLPVRTSCHTSTFLKSILHINCIRFLHFDMVHAQISSYMRVKRRSPVCRQAMWKNGPDSAVTVFFFIRDDYFN